MKSVDYPASRWSYGGQGSGSTLLRPPQDSAQADFYRRVNPDLVGCDEQGKVYGVRYDAVNAMLLNEFLKEPKAFLEEQRKVQELEAKAAQQQKQIEALTAGLQKVSAQLEANKPAPRVAESNQ